MRGKKTNPQFVSDYITACIQKGADSPEEIVDSAKIEITKIDLEIQRMEESKIYRSKLLDVIATLDSSKEDKTQQAKLLPFFELKYPEICKKICDNLKDKPLSTEDMYKLSDNAKYCIKQLLMHKIIIQSDLEIICGERFDEYMKFVLREE